MKKLVFILLIISSLSLIKSYSQYLTMGQLQYLLNLKSVNSIDNYLTTRGWDFMDGKVYDELKVVKWAYKPSIEYYSFGSDNATKAYAWLHVFTYKGKPGLLVYEFFNKSKYLQLKRSLPGYGYKFLKQEFSNDTIYYHYISKNFILEIAYHTEFDDNYGFNSRSYRITVTLTKRYSIFDFDNGQKEKKDAWGRKIIYHLKDGEYHGKFVVYYPDGSIYITGNFKNGKKQGVHKKYNEDGTLSQVVYYKDDEPYRVKTYYPNGKLKMDAQVSLYLFERLSSTIFTTDDWILDGQVKEYFQNGQIESIMNYKRGHLAGHYVLYDSLGRIVNIGNLKEKQDVTDTSVNFVGYFKQIKYLSDVDTNEKIVVEGHFNENSQRQGTWKKYLVKNNDTSFNYIKNYNNGKYHGQVTYATTDSIVFAHYLNGLLDGKTVVYKKLQFVPFPTIDTTGAYLDHIAYYKNGYKHGKYIVFEPYTGKIIALANYRNGKKNGKTILYYPTLANLEYGNPNNYINVPDSLRKMAENNYFNGLPDGLSIYYHHVPVDCNGCYQTKCKDCIIKADTFHYVIWRVITGYKLGVKDGKFQIVNEQAKPLVIGHYSSDKKAGTWKFYLKDHPDTLFKLIEYSDTAVYATRFLGGKKWLTLTFKNNVLTNLKVFDLNTGKLTTDYKLTFYPDQNYFKIKAKQHNIDYTYNYTIKVENYPEQDYISDTITKNILDFYMYRFLPYTLVSPDKPVQTYTKVKILLDGSYLKEKAGKPYIKGFYKNGKKDSIWQYYIYNQNLIKQVTYHNGKPVSLQFYNILDNKPLTGYYVEKIPGDRYKVYKIRKGKIHNEPKIYTKKQILRKLQHRRLKNVKSL